MVQEEHGKEPSETESPLPGALDSAHRQIQGAQDALQGPFACSVRRFWAVWGVAWVYRAAVRQRRRNAQDTDARAWQSTSPESPGSRDKAISAFLES